MPPGYFASQMPPPSSFQTGPVRPVLAIGQIGQTAGHTGAMVAILPSPTPLATIPISVAPGRTNETMTYTPPHTTTASSAPQGYGPHYGPIPNATQTMTCYGKWSRSRAHAVQYRMNSAGNKD